MAPSAPDRSPGERQALVAALARPDAYPHPVESPIRTIETHVSNLFLTGEYVYKVKKPVDLGFVDYSTLDRRREFTLLELELNRRLSPGVYIDVATVRRTDDGRFLVSSDAGAGEVHEHALRMRQLPAERAMSRLLKQGRVETGEIRRVAEFIAAFHARAPAVPADSESGGVGAVRAVTTDNLEALAGYRRRLEDLDALDDVSAYTEAFLEARGALLERRKRAGRVRDCHGDLHTGNIFLIERAGQPPEIQMIDRIEFNERFRFIDVASDVAFLAMDLEHAGRSDLRLELLDAYARASGDRCAGRLVEFFEVYRAMVRYKVTLMLAEERGGDEVKVAEARSYARLAAAIMARQRPRALYVMTGLMGSGKSTVAAGLACRWELAHASSDVVRKTLAGIDPGRLSDERVRDELYSGEMYDRTYGELVRLGDEALSGDRSVVLDAAFLKRRYRAQARELAAKHGVPLFLVECRLEDEIAQRRLRERYESGLSASDGRPELLEWHRAQREAPRPDEYDAHVVVDTGGEVRDVAARALRAAWRAVLARG